MVMVRLREAVSRWVLGCVRHDSKGVTVLRLQLFTTMTQGIDCKKLMRM